MLRLKDLREDNDYTQKQIAEILNCKQNTYQQYESEKRQIPIDMLKILAILYNTNIDYITYMTDESKKSNWKKEIKIKEKQIQEKLQMIKKGE